MLFLPPRKLLLSPSSKGSRIFVMGSKNFLLLKSSAAPATSAVLHSLIDCSSSPRTLLFDSYSRKSLRLFASPKQLYLSYQRAAGYSYTPYSAMPIPRPSEYCLFLFSCFFRQSFVLAWFVEWTYFLGSFSRFQGLLNELPFLIMFRLFLDN